MFLTKIPWKSPQLKRKCNFWNYFILIFFLLVINQFIYFIDKNLAVFGKLFATNVVDFFLLNYLILLLIKYLHGPINDFKAHKNCTKYFKIYETIKILMSFHSFPFLYVNLETSFNRSLTLIIINGAWKEFMFATIFTR